jgi:hypothetical protein
VRVGGNMARPGYLRRFGDDLGWVELHGFGMTSPVSGWSESQVIQAAKDNDAKFKAGKLLITTHLQDSRFGFDPLHPEAIYILDPYWGNGPAAYNAVPSEVGKFISGAATPPWPGQISRDEWIKTLPPGQQLAMTSPVLTLPSASATTVSAPADMSAAGITAPAPSIFDQILKMLGLA